MSATLPIAIIGAGPVGLAAAAHLVERRLPFVVLEAGADAGAAVSQWGHVRLFSPWRYNTDAAARRLLTAAGWHVPDPEELPTGTELITRYLQPLAGLPDILPHLAMIGSPHGRGEEGLHTARQCPEIGCWAA